MSPISNKIQAKSKFALVKSWLLTLHPRSVFIPHSTRKHHGRFLFLGRHAQQGHPYTETLSLKVVG